MVRAPAAQPAHRLIIRALRAKPYSGVWLLELSKCVIAGVETELERWLKFFTEGHRLDDDHLPDWMQTEEMRQAMSTLQAFSEKERAYHQYQARQNYLRQQQSIQNQIKALSAEIEQARAAEERERAEKEAALAEIAWLKALLQNER